MNIFLLDTDVTKCAKYHCDKHIVKMPIEYAQLISSVLHHVGLEAPYKETHKNHPCAIWARQLSGNYTFLYDLAIAVGKEYTARYGKVHKSTQALDNVPRVLEELPIGKSPLPNCTTIKDYYPELNLVDKYRLYYLRDKEHILKYNYSKEPWWMGDRFYQQQLKTLGTCPGDGKNKKPKRLTKDEILTDFKVKGIKKLLVKDIELLLGLKEFPVLEMPEGRLKAPYIEQCKKIHEDVNWAKLTVSDMKEVIASVA